MSDELKNNEELIKKAIFHNTDWGVIKCNGKYGAIDRNGNVIAPCEFENSTLLANYIVKNNMINLIFKEVRQMGISVIKREDITKISEVKLLNISNSLLTIDNEKKLSIFGLYLVMTRLYEIKANEYNYTNHPDYNKYVNLFMNEYKNHKVVRKDIYVEAFKTLEEYIKNDKNKKSSKFAFFQELRKKDKENSSRRK